MGSPKRLEIREMETTREVRSFRNVKQSARDDMIDVPAFWAIVRPGHIGLEFGFEIDFEIRD